MELGQLEYFLEAARREHMTQAAEALHITQPALSRVIARLEADLGMPLFNREGKCIELNEYGRLVQSYAERIFTQLDELRLELDEMAKGYLGEVHVGSSFPSGEPNWVLDQVRQFSLARSNIRFHLQQYTTSKLWKALYSREIDLALATERIQAENMVWIPLFKERVGVIMSRQHPLAQKPELSLADLNGQRFYCNNANSDVQELTYRLCERAGFRPNIYFQCEFPSFIGEAVSMGYGISLIAYRGYLQSNARTEHELWESNILFRELTDDVCFRECGAAYLKEHHLPRAAQAFLEHIVQSFPAAEIK